MPAAVCPLSGGHASAETEQGVLHVHNSRLPTSFGEQEAVADERLQNALQKCVLPEELLLRSGKGFRIDRHRYSLIERD